MFVAPEVQHIYFVAMAIRLWVFVVRAGGERRQSLPAAICPGRREKGPVPLSSKLQTILLS